MVLGKIPYDGWVTPPLSIVSGMIGNSTFSLLQPCLKLLDHAFEQ